MLASINPEALPVLRIAGAIFLLINIAGALYIFRNRRRFFGRDADIEGDIPAVRKVRVQLVVIIWSVLTALLTLIFIQLWR